MDTPRLKISDRLQSLMNYPKFAGPPRMLVLRSQYWLDEACGNAARALGWDVLHTPVQMAGMLPREQIAGLLEGVTAFRPDFIFSVNLSGMDRDGLFARFFADLRVPHVTWFVDDPRTILMGSTAYGSDYAVALSWERSYLGYLRDCGFAESHWMPLAVDASQFDLPPPEAWEAAPAFVGHSMTAFARREWAELQAWPDLADEVERAFAAGRVTRENFARGLDALLGESSNALDAEQRRHAEMVCFIDGTRRLREQLIHRLAPLGLVVRGDDDWSNVTPQCGPPVPYSPDLPRFYNACPVNLNCTSIQMATAVNQRVFDCPAAGGFLLTDAQSDLRELFDQDRELAVYKDPEDCEERLRGFMASPAARLEVIQRARRRVLAEHTYAHRLRQIEALLKLRFAG